MKQRYNTYLDSEIVKQLQELAKADRRTPAETIAFLVAKEYEKRQEAG